MSRNEHSVVISQPVKNHSMLLENTMRYIAERNANMSAKNSGRRSGAPSGSWAWKSSMYPRAYTQMPVPMTPMMNVMTRDSESTYRHSVITMLWAKAISNTSEPITCTSASTMAATFL